MKRGDAWHLAFFAVWGRWMSRDLDVADLDRGRPARDEPGQQREGCGAVLRVDAPPDGVAAGEAGRGDRLVAPRARAPEPGRERGSAVGGCVAVVEEESRHEASLPMRASRIIGGAP